MISFIKNHYFLITVFIVYVIYVLLIPSFSYQGDTEEWIRWAQYLLEHPAFSVYQSDINYPPLFIYILKLFTLFYNTPTLIQENILLLKPVVLLFDFLPLIVLYLIYKKLIKWWYIFLLLLHPGYIHNSVIWGQIDAIPSFFCNTALLLFNKYPQLSIILFIMGLCSKIQMVILLPVLILFWFVKYYPNNHLISGIYLLLIGILTIVILFIPFLTHHTFTYFLNKLNHQVGLYNSTSLNAYNIWYLLLKEHPFLVKDTTVFMGLSYRYWGIILFAIASFIALFPSVLLAFCSPKKTDSITELFLLLSAIITLLFFFFNTEMHERYSHPALLALFYYGAINKKFVFFIIAASLYFFNVELVLPFFSINKWLLLLSEKGIALLFAGFILYLYKELYLEFYKPLLTLGLTKFKKYN